MTHLGRDVWRQTDHFVHFQAAQQFMKLENSVKLQEIAAVETLENGGSRLKFQQVLHVQSGLIKLRRIWLMIRSPDSGH